MERATKSTLERLRNEGVRFARTKPDSKVPADLNWKQSNLNLNDLTQIYDENRFVINLLSDSNLIVIDIDDPDDDHAKSIMEVLDKWNCAKAPSRKGFHYYLRRDNDTAAVLNGKERADVKSSNRKNAAKVGDVLAGAATAYEMTGEFINFNKVKGLYKLLTHSDHLSPTARVKEIYNTALKSLQALVEGNRNNGMFSTLLTTNRRLKQAGVGSSWKLVARKLIDVYEREINPNDANSNFAERLDEIDCIIGAVKEIAGLAEGADICEAVLNGYLSEHDNEVIISADGSRDDLREVYEWAVDDEEWVKRGLGVIIDDRLSLRATLNDQYCQASTDITGDRPPLIKQNKAVDTMIDALKSTAMISTPLSQFDQERSGTTMLRTKHRGENHIYLIDPHMDGVKWKRLERNLPEYKLLATLGEMSRVSSQVWDNFLMDVLIDQELIDYFGLLVASAFVPSSSPRFVICNGLGANGKSVLLTTLARALNDYACTTTPDAYTSTGWGTDKRQLDTRSLLVGKKVAVCTESSKAPLDLTFVKALTSGELIEVGGMYQKSSHVRLRAVPFIATNHLPKLFEVSPAVRRRIMVVPFDRTFGSTGDKPADLSLMRKLSHDLPCIRQWVMRYIERYLALNCEIEIPARVQAVSDEYMESQRHPIEAMLDSWLDPLPADQRLMKLGRRDGKGRDATFSGILSLAVMIHQHGNMQSKLPERLRMKEWLSRRNILPDHDGRLNCKPTNRLVRYLQENLSEGNARHVWDNLFHTKPIGAEKPFLPFGDETQQPVKVVDVQAEMSEEMPW